MNSAVVVDASLFDALLAEIRALKESLGQRRGYTD